MNIHYLQNTNLRSTVQVYLSFFSRINLNFQCMSTLVYTVCCQKQPSELRCSVKKGVLEDFVNFVWKHLCWSLFLIKPQTWHLFWGTSASDCFCTALAPLTITYPFYFIFSTFFLIITAATVNISDVCFGSNSKDFKEFKSGISFSLTITTMKVSLSLLLFSFAMIFLSFSRFVSFFLGAAHKKDSFWLRVD